MFKDKIFSNINEVNGLTKTIRLDLTENARKYAETEEYRDIEDYIFSLKYQGAEYVPARITLPSGRSYNLNDFDNMPDRKKKAESEDLVNQTVEAIKIIIKQMYDKDIDDKQLETDLIFNTSLYQDIYKKSHFYCKAYMQISFFKVPYLKKAELTEIAELLVDAI